MGRKGSCNNNTAALAVPGNRVESIECLYFDQAEAWIVVIVFTETINTYRGELEKLAFTMPSKKEAGALYAALVREWKSAAQLGPKAPFEIPTPERIT